MMMQRALQHPPTSQSLYTLGLRVSATVMVAPARIAAAALIDQSYLPGDANVDLHLMHLMGQLSLSNTRYFDRFSSFGLAQDVNFAVFTSRTVVSN